MPAKPAKLNASNDYRFTLSIKEVEELLEREDGFRLVAEELNKIESDQIAEEVSQFIHRAAYKRFDELKFTEVDVRIEELEYALASLLQFDGTGVNPIFHSNVLAYLGHEQQAAKLFEVAYEDVKAHWKTMPAGVPETIENMRLCHKVRVELSKGEYAKAFRIFNKIEHGILGMDPQLVRRVASAHCYRALEKGIKTKTGQKGLLEGLLYFDLYKQIGGRSAKHYDTLAFVHKEMGATGSAALDIETGMDNAYANHDEVGMTRLVLMGLDLIETDDPVCNIDGKRFSKRMSTPQRVEWMRRRLGEGETGLREIVDKTGKWKPETMSKLEATIIARAAASVEDIERCRSICGALGHDGDGNVVRLMSLAHCNFSEGKHKETVELIKKVLNALDEADSDADSVDQVVMDGYLIISDLALRNKDVNLLLDFFENCPWGSDSVLLRMMAAEMVMSIVEGSLKDKAIIADVILSDVDPSERIPMWYLVSATVKAICGNCAGSLKLLNEGRKKVAEMLEESSSEDPELDDIDDKELLEQFDSQIGIVKKVMACGGNIRGYMEHEAKAFMERSGFTVVRTVKQSEGPILLICTHAAEKGLARIVACGRNSFQTDLDFKLKTDDVDNMDEEMANKGRVLSMLIPAIDAPRVKPADWRVQILNLLGSQIFASNVPLSSDNTLRTVDDSPFPGSKFSGVAVYQPGNLPQPKEDEATIVELVPLYTQELDYASIFTVDQLFRRLEKIQFLPLKRNRPNVCAERNWKPLIAREKIRPLVEPPLGHEYAFVSQYILLEGKDVGYFFKRDEESDFSGWVFLAEGQRPDDKDLGETMAQTDLNVVANFAPYVMPWLQAAPHSAFIHEGNGTISKIDYDGLNFVEPNCKHRTNMC